MSSYIHTSQKLVDDKMNDLSKLTQNIQTKDRLIELNHRNYEESKRRIKVLRKLYIPIFFNILLYFILLYKLLNKTVVVSLMFLGYLIYGVYVFYQFNVLQLRSIVSPEIKDIKKLIIKGEKMIKKEIKDLEKQKKQNCIKPPPRKQHNKVRNYYFGESGDAVVTVDKKGYFHYNHPNLQSGGEILNYDVEFE